jgi:hypothetical protein
MKRLTIFGCAAIALVIAAAFLAAASVSSANSKGGADRVIADVFVQVIQEPDLFNPVPRQLGIAHIRIHAFDIDSTVPLSLSGQTADEGSVTCEPADSEACSVLPVDDTPIFWADFSSSADPSTVTISFPVGPTGATGDLLDLHDGGSPANRQTGEISVAGAAETADSLRWGDWRGRPSFEAWVLSGNVTVNRK